MENGVDMEQQNAKPMSVKGPDGQKLTMADLPSPNISRWVTRRKAEVVAAVAGGLLSRKAACDRYNLTDEEFEGWERLYLRHGAKGLRTTRLQQYRR
ncbi:hypothetical protein HAD_07845 [Hyphomonas adhaerens MHS-3]|uniref:DUF1153 domain-containing protein n=2 Tax=Hyphomonas adhaerens TaxID=81029 RepID=A0A069E5L0_9PROT|nr:hypothetical protein HAD_07845 [Hyphomonas adhaerens MHS-3]